MKNKILIAGGTGFLGFHIIKKLSKKNFIIHSLSTRQPSKYRKLKKAKYIICNIKRSSL